jgi:hypothetical protein
MRRRHGAALSQRRASIHARTSSTRQAVIRSARRTGAGNFFALTNRQSVAEENGRISGTSWDWRKKPVAGSCGAGEGLADMLRVTSWEAVK